MACFHPLKAWPVGLSSSGKTNYKITSYGVDHCDIYADGRVVPSTVPIQSSLAKSVVKDYIEIPCGNCLGCRIAYSKQWADRCMLELQYHEENYFLTLTYDDYFVPRSGYCDEVTGEWFDTLTLRKKDLQKFHKDLRKKLYGSAAGEFKYFACGEYGDQTFRPHYHEIAFGLHIPDKRVYRVNPDGVIYYNSDFLSNIWKKGHVVIGEVTWQSCAYVARYVMKKLKGEASSFYDDHGLEKPFLLMSRNPGIGRKYYEEHPELFDMKCVYLPTEDGNREVYPSKYFKNLLSVDDPEKYDILKERNKCLAGLGRDNKLSFTDLDYLDYLSVEEESLERKLKALPRKEI